MSSNPPVVLDALVRILVDFAVRAFVRSSDPTVVTLRAQTVISISEALEQVDAGDPSGAAAFAAAVQGAISSSATSDPGLADALETLADVLESKVVSVAEALQGSALGAALGQFNVAVFAQAATIAQEYIPATPAPTNSAKASVEPKKMADPRMGWRLLPPNVVPRLKVPAHARVSFQGVRS